MFEKIQKIIAEQLYIDSSSITEETKFIDDLGADSLDIVQMLIAMEKTFEISFGEDEIAEIKTVGDAKRLIEKKIKHNNRMKNDYPLAR